MKNFASVIVAAFLIASCSAVNHTTNEYIQVEDDPFKTEKVYNGISSTDAVWDGLQREFVHTSYIKSFEDRETGQFTHELWVEVSYYGDIHRFERAAYIGGRNAGFRFINESHDSCIDLPCRTTERFAIPLDEQFLIDNKDGFRIKAFAQSGQGVVLELSNLQISGQLSYLEIK